MTITVRTAPFGAIQQPALWWLGSDPSATAFYTALSAAFPPGERFFIETLTGIAGQLPSPLADMVRDFARQEANHARQHLLFNRLIAQTGHATAKLEAKFERDLAGARAYSPLARVAFTAALEHVTTMIAREILSNPESFAGTAPDIRRFWKWHAVEEIEHKSIAFDAYLILGADMTAFRRWQFRVRAFRAATRVFLSNTWNGSALLARNGHGPFRTKARLLWFLLGKPGIYRRSFADWLAFFAPGYHPTSIDDSRLLASAEPVWP